MKRILVATIALCCAFLAFAQKIPADSPLRNLPPYIRQVTTFGERADWSLDGSRILFLEKTFGDVFELELASGDIRPLTHHYFHEGYTRALYLANGDILLSGAPTFDAKDPWKSRDARNAELWVLKADLSAAAIPLGVHCKEGPAVSRTEMRIAWTLGSTIRMGEIDYENGNPALAKVKPLFSSTDMPAPVTGFNLETQNFRPKNENELIFNAFGGEGKLGAEVMGFDIEKGIFVNYTKDPKFYDEPEGTFPDGIGILVESNRHRVTYNGMQEFLTLDIYRMNLDGEGRLERITYFNDNPRYKASNPVVSDDGKFIAFQYAQTEDMAGMGRGILVLDYEAWMARKE